MVKGRIESIGGYYQEGHVIKTLLVELSNNLWVNQQAALVSKLAASVKKRIGKQVYCDCSDEEENKRCHSCSLSLFLLNEHLYKQLNLREALKTHPRDFRKLFIDFKDYFINLISIREKGRIIKYYHSDTTELAREILGNKKESFIKEEVLGYTQEKFDALCRSYRLSVRESDKTLNAIGRLFELQSDE